MKILIYVKTKKLSVLENFCTEKRQKVSLKIFPSITNYIYLCMSLAIGNFLCTMKQDENSI